MTLSIECACGFTDYDAPAVYILKMVKGRRDWLCCECGVSMPKGTEHEHVKGLTDGGWWEARTCITCCRIRNDYCRDGHTHGTLREALGQCLGFDYVTGEDSPWADDHCDGLLPISTEAP